MKDMKAAIFEGRRHTHNLRPLVTYLRQMIKLSGGDPDKVIQPDEWDFLGSVKLPNGGPTSTRDEDGVRALDKRYVAAYKLFWKMFDENPNVPFEELVDAVCAKIDLTTYRNDGQSNLVDMIFGKREEAKKLAKDAGIWRNHKSVHSRKRRKMTSTTVVQENAGEGRSINASSQPVTQ